MDNNTNNTSIFLNNPEENLSISQCKLITHTNNNELQLSLLSVFGPKKAFGNKKIYFSLFYMKCNVISYQNTKN